MSNKNSNWPAAQQPELPAEKMAAQVRAMEELRELPAIDYKDPRQIEERIKLFFNFCAQNELRPTVELMALSIGVSRVSLWYWEQEGSRRGEVISKAKQLLAALIEQWGVCGKINPSVMIFLQKNHFGYKDNITLEANQTTNSLDALPTAAEVRQRLPQIAKTDTEPDLDDLLKDAEMD